MSDLTSSTWKRLTFNTHLHVRRGVRWVFFADHAADFTSIKGFNTAQKPLKRPSLCPRQESVPIEKPQKQPQERAIVWSENYCTTRARPTRYYTWIHPAWKPLPAPSYTIPIWAPACFGHILCRATQRPSGLQVTSLVDCASCGSIPSLRPHAVAMPNTRNAKCV